MKKAIIVVLLVAAICAFAGAENLKDTRVSQGISSKSTLTKQGLGTATKTNYGWAKKAAKKVAAEFKKFAAKIKNCFPKCHRKISTFVKGVYQKVEVAFVELHGKTKTYFDVQKQKNKGSKGYVSKLPYSRHAMMGTNVYVPTHPINCGVVYDYGRKGNDIADEACVTLVTKRLEKEEISKDAFLEVGVLALEGTGPSGCDVKGIFSRGHLPNRCPERGESVEFTATDALAKCVEALYETKKPAVYQNKNTGDRLELWVENDQLWAKDNCFLGRRRLLQAGGTNAAS
jgi:hypothetical protein